MGLLLLLRVNMVDMGKEASHANRMVCDGGGRYVSSSKQIKHNTQLVKHHKSDD